MIQKWFSLEKKVEEIVEDCSTCVFKIEYHDEDGINYHCYLRSDCDINNPIKCPTYEFDGFP